MSSGDREFICVGLCCAVSYQLAPSIRLNFIIIVVVCIVLGVQSINKHEILINPFIHSFLD